MKFPAKALAACIALTAGIAYAETEATDPDVIAR